MMRYPWRAGVIAAGRGERLRTPAGTLKPLVRVAGQTLIEHVLASLAEAAPRDVVVIINDESIGVRDRVSERAWPFPIRWLVETTPSSMHSFLRVVETLAADGDPGPFLISTVDTVASPGAFRRFAEAASSAAADVVLAVTPPDDDDKPLLVRVNREARVMAIGSRVAGAAPNGNTADGAEAGVAVAAAAVYATAGYYAVRSSVLLEAAQARADGLTALRLFLERLVTRGLHVAAVPVPASIDVDRPADVRAAEALLRQARA